MTEPRNLEARRLIADQLADLEASKVKAERRWQSLDTQTRKKARELKRLDGELAGLAQALDALGGPPPAEPEDDE